MKRYVGLDILKFIAAFGIVGCHLALPEKTVGANIIMRLTDINVGIFAAISGFFIAMGLEKSLPLREAIQKRALRLLPIYIFWSGIYFVVSIVLGRHFERLSDIGYLCGVFFQGGASCHLWYLIALFYFTVAVLLVDCVLPRIARAPLVQVMISLGCLYVSTLGDYSFWWGYYFARLAAFALVGMVLYGACDRIFRVPGVTWIGVAIAGVALRLIGVSSVHKFVQDYVAAILILPLFVTWARGKGVIEKTLADLSLGVYLIHPLIAMVIGLLAKRYLLPVGLPTMMLLWVFVWLIAFLTTIVMQKLSIVRRFV